VKPRRCFPEAILCIMGGAARSGCAERGLGNYGRIHQKYCGSLVTALRNCLVRYRCLVFPLLSPILPPSLPLAAQALSTLIVLTSSVLPFATPESWLSSISFALWKSQSIFSCLVLFPSFCLVRHPQPAVAQCIVEFGLGQTELVASLTWFPVRF
jgi:hypothetical protein